MQTQLSKSEILQLIKTERGAWDALLASIESRRMTQPGVAGDWSVKDVIAHLTIWEEKPLALLEARRGRGVVQARPWPDGMSTDDTNDWIYRTNHDRSLQDLLDRSRTVHGRLVELLQKMPEEDLNVSDMQELEGGTVADYIASDTYDHYREHTAGVRAWLDRTASMGNSG